MNKNSGTWWKAPWSYKESFTLVAGLIATGIMLQLSIGNFNYEIIRFPVNIFMLILTLIAVVAITFRHKSHLFQWLSGVPLSVANISGLLFYSIIMGHGTDSGQCGRTFAIRARCGNPFVAFCHCILLHTDKSQLCHSATIAELQVERLCLLSQPFGITCIALLCRTWCSRPSTLRNACGRRRNRMACVQRKRRCT